MKLTDLLPLEEWIAFEQELNQRFGLDTNVFDINGYRISDFKQWANQLCPAIKATDKGQSFICAVAHMNVAGQAMQTKGPVIEECDAGLVKIVIPIYVKDEFIGAVGAWGGLTRWSSDIERRLWFLAEWSFVDRLLPEDPDA